MQFKQRKDKKLFQEYAVSGIFLDDFRDTPKSYKHIFAKCLWNALITFLLVLSITGLFVDSLEIPCILVIIGIIQLILSLYFSFLYLNSIVFNLGYIFMLVIIVFIISSMYMIVNSGFSAILNLIIIKVDEVMNLPYLREFNEFFTNRYISTTACISLISILFTCLVNMFISRRKSFLGLVIFLLPLFELSIYLSDDFNILYPLIMLFALLLYVITKNSDATPGEYKKRTRNYSISSGILHLHNDKIERRNSISFAALVSASVLFFSIIAFTFVSSLYTSSSSSLKAKSDVVVYNLAWRGLESIFNKGENQVGGMQNGSFGNVNSISFDGETDLEVSFVPFSSDPVYIRSFIADYYDNDERHWVDTASEYKEEYFSNSEDEYTKTYNALSEKNTDYKFGTGGIIISNVAAGNSVKYHPYYISYANSQINSSIGNENVYNYSMSLYDIYELDDMSEELYITSTDDDQYAMDFYLQVPVNIQDDLELFCNKNNFKGNKVEIIEQIQYFFANNYQYTLSPGATPKDEDYVLYFLNEQKKGICVHFASSACLLLRTMGIPARYVEGYSFDSSIYTDAVLYEDSNRFTKEQWYDGYSEINFANPVSIDLTDANAHAWVEVFFEGFGWVPVEFTVGQNDSAAPGKLEELLNSLGKSYGDNQAVNALNAIQNLADSNAVKAIKSFFTSALMSFSGVVLITILLILLIRKLLLNLRIYYLKSTKRTLYQYKELVKMLAALKTKYSSDAYLDDMPDENVYSAQTVKNILVNHFEFDCNPVDDYINHYLQLNFSNQSNIDVEIITDEYRQLICQLISRLKTYDKWKYSLYFFTFRRIKH